MTKKILIIGFILVSFCIILAGCVDFLTDINNKITYESHPTSILYEISYGYRINCTGFGEYKIDYNCDEPEVLFGSILSKKIHDNSSISKILATYNKMYSWTIDSNEIKNYDLGLTASVGSNSYIISDLNGNQAFTIQQIKNESSDIFNRFTKSQSNETLVFIDPENEGIREISFNIYDKSLSDNSFIIAKEIFVWLKQNTEYKIHIYSNNVQPCNITLNSRYGDCDDLSFLYISLCRSVGIPARFIRGFLIEKDSATPHAWVEVYVGGDVGKSGWIPVECAGTSDNIISEVNQNFGIESADHLRLFTDDGSNESIEISLSGLSYVAYGSINLDTEPYVEIKGYNVARSNKLEVNQKGIRTYI